MHLRCLDLASNRVQGQCQHIGAFQVGSKFDFVDFATFGRRVAANLTRTQRNRAAQILTAQEAKNSSTYFPVFTKFANSVKFWHALKLRWFLEVFRDLF